MDQTLRRRLVGKCVSKEEGEKDVGKGKHIKRGNEVRPCMGKEELEWVKGDLVILYFDYFDSRGKREGLEREKSNLVFFLIYYFDGGGKKEGLESEKVDLVILECYHFD